MNLEKALKVLHLVKCDCLGYARDLSYTPTREDVGKAIEAIEEEVKRTK